MTEIDIINDKILITGGNGFLGSHTVDTFREKGANNLVLFSSKQFDLRKENDVKKLFIKYPNIDIVVHVAGDVGGIRYSSNFPAQQFYNNVMMNTLILHYSYKNNIRKFVGIGSVCAYPEVTPIPFKEEYVWNGYPVPTNDAYGLSKRSLLAQSIAYNKEYNFNAIHLMPINLYGPRDDFSLEDSHVIPALIIKFIDAKEKDKNSVEVWGSGEASREFIYVKDTAEAIFLATQKYNKIQPVNIGTGYEIKIKDLAYLIAELISYNGEIIFDKNKPEGQMRRQLDVIKAKKEFGFIAKTDFRKGLKETIKWYNENIKGC
ncbi:GDP-fucose synthetase [Thermoplasmatales archaeon SG8-52-1]|nr:MAG: GDP-fucose synthetase [Thermoplasmatales archaeon SG8-52-1]